MLSLTRYQVALEALDELDLPAFLGSTLRGAFGHAFRRIACPAPADSPCPIPDTCPYHLIFESAPPPDSDALRTHEEIPRPFVIAPRIATDAGGPIPRAVYRPGEQLAFELTLVGRAQEFFPYFVVALREVERIGRGRRAVRLARIDALAPQVCARWDHADGRLVYDAAENLVRGHGDPLTLADCAAAAPAGDRAAIEFLTQTRLKHEGRFVRMPEFQIFFRRLLGRLSSLARFHCGAPLEVDFKGLIELAGGVRLARDATRWTRWQRYSSRQDRRMEWEGIIGRADYQGDLAPFWPYLLFGQHAHVGHGATFGLGKYRFVERYCYG